MDYSEDDRILIDYLDGNLEAAGVQVLENRLMRETKLKQKLALYEWSRQTVRVKAIRNLVEQSHNGFLNRNNGNQVSEKFDTTRVVRIPFFAKWIGIAASILFFIAIGGVLNLSSLSGTDLYQDKFLSYEISSFRGDSENASSIQDLYRSGDFAAVLAVFPVEALEGLSKDELLLLGISALETNKPQQALIYLDLLNQRNSLDQSGELQDERDFYTALANIQMNNFTEGYALISDITQDSAHKYNRNFPLGYRAKIKMLSLIK
ncbi:hypothetical protein [Lunatibacter salilacus]|uniref:hypothetical protein n=1 Tax=Lunatibacter salilacus TaxID=2483804 RepID=UPI00131B6143|nr:hypothetical protein [Lunatibacter salilacus]